MSRMSKTWLFLDLLKNALVASCFFLDFWHLIFLDIEAAMLTELQNTATAEGGWTNLLPNLFRASSFNNGIEATLTCPARL